VILAGGLLLVGFLPHFSLDRIYNLWFQLVKRVMPELFVEIETLVRESGLNKQWEALLVLWFSLSIPAASIFFAITLKYSIFNYLFNLLVFLGTSISPFVTYLLIRLKGRRRYKSINSDIRQVYRSLRLVLRAGGTAEEALSKGVKYTTILQNYLEGVLVNWGDSGEYLDQMRKRFNNLEVDSLAAYLLEIKRDVSPELVKSIERQEKRLADFRVQEIERAVKRDETQAQVIFVLFLIAQFYLVAMPIINEAASVFRSF